MRTANKKMKNKANFIPYEPKPKKTNFSRRLDQNPAHDGKVAWNKESKVKYILKKI